MAFEVVFLGFSVGGFRWGLNRMVVGNRSLWRLDRSNCLAAWSLWGAKRSFG